jgi:RHS repeat-associated protein
MRQCHRTARLLVAATVIGVGSLSAEVAAAPSLYCPVGSTFFAGNFALSNCTAGGLANTCWAPASFPGSTPITGSYPSTNYACASSAPMPGALENTLHAYDGNGNQVATVDPLGRATNRTYDALNRLMQVLDPAGNPTKYAYNLNDALTQVIDPRSLPTAYEMNGFGEVTTQTSPDTGITKNVYDAAGNLLSRTDARGATATYTYDPIHRVTQAVYSRLGTNSETHAFTYDQGTNGKGRLTGFSNESGTTTLAYESHGRLLSKTQATSVANVLSFTSTVSYTYNTFGQLATLRTPSGFDVNYSYTNNRVSSVTINTAPGMTTLISGAAAEPFGPLSTWKWGNGLYTQRTYDNDGRLASWEYRNGVTVLRNDISWDIGGRVTAITNPADATLGSAYQYDALDRLAVSQVGAPVTTTQQFNYDAVGNRLNRTVNGAVTNYSYDPASNRLLALAGATSRSYVYDAVGNPTTIDGSNNVYSNANRLIKVDVAANDGATRGSYKLNPMGQRLVDNSANLYWIYDDRGRMLGEYNAGTGALIQEYVWIEDLPVAVLQRDPAPPRLARVSYVLADHLDTPRAVVRPSDNVLLWRWDNTDPFGANAANTNPAGAGTFGFNLRFPGQYYDYLTGTNYNYFRDYDPMIGRYTESDPIGLGGGLNTYLYTDAAPIDRSDRLGLFAYHGNWCGPDWTGGFRREYGQIGPGDDVLPPIDALDRCCMVHDICYWQCRCDHGCDESQRRNCMIGCDRTLANCAAAAGAHRGSPLWWWMNYGKASPGPNAPSCRR